MFGLWKSSANNKDDVSETISNIYEETVTIVDDFLDIPVENKDKQINQNKNYDIEDINISGLC
jgi:hypothetical protein